MTLRAPEVDWRGTAMSERDLRAVRLTELANCGG